MTTEAPFVYRDSFFSFRRPSRSILSRFIAHLLIRLLIIATFPSNYQAAAALFPVSMLWPLVAVENDSSGVADEASDPSIVTQDTWGNFRFPTELDASMNRFAFTGYQWDRETGLYHAKARFYSPEIGRFISQDTFLGNIDDPPSLHRYFYANANPTRYVDPTGYKSLGEVARRELERRRRLHEQGTQATLYVPGKYGGIVPSDAPVDINRPKASGADPGLTPEEEKWISEEAAAIRAEPGYVPIVIEESRPAPAEGKQEPLSPQDEAYEIARRSYYDKQDAVRFAARSAAVMQRLSEEGIDLAYDPVNNVVILASGKTLTGYEASRKWAAVGIGASVLMVGGGKIVKMAKKADDVLEHVDEIGGAVKKTHKHHTIPRQVRKSRRTGRSMLPEHLVEHPDIKGRPGMPNRWDVPGDEHLGKQGIHRTGGQGGKDYNRRFIAELDDLESRVPDRSQWTADDIVDIRDRLATEFNIERYR